MYKECVFNEAVFACVSDGSDVCAEFFFSSSGHWFHVSRLPPQRGLPHDWFVIVYNGVWSFRNLENQCITYNHSVNTCSIKKSPWLLSCSVYAAVAHIWFMAVSNLRFILLKKNTHINSF